MKTLGIFFSKKSWFLVIGSLFHIIMITYFPRNSDMLRTFSNISCSCLLGSCMLGIYQPKNLSNNEPFNFSFMHFFFKSVFSRVWIHQGFRNCRMLFTISVLLLKKKMLLKKYEEKIRFWAVGFCSKFSTSTNSTHRSLETVCEKGTQKCTEAPYHAQKFC